MLYAGTMSRFFVLDFIHVYMLGAPCYNKCMAYNVEYILADDGLGFNAIYNGRRIGEITFVRVGMDKMIIDHTSVDAPYRNAQIGLGLVSATVGYARNHGRKIIALCPFAAAMFRRHPEFDDVRLINSN